MIILKKLALAPLLIVSFIWLLSQVNPFLTDYNLIWSLNLATLTQLGLLVLSLICFSLFFVLFVTVAYKWEFVLPTIVVVCLLPLLFIPYQPAVVILGGTFLALLVSYLLLKQKLNNYLSFQPTSLLTPSINQTITFILLTLSLGFYLTTNSTIKQNGFKLPESIIDLSLNFAQNQLPNNSQLTQQLNLPAEQLEQLKQNPQLLKQFGLDPSILNQLDQPQTKSPAQNLVKSVVEEQIQKIIQPYQIYIPIILAVLFFLTLKSLASLLSIPLPMVVWLIFWFLEKVGFTKYQIEMRQVKKLVV